MNYRWRRYKPEVYLYYFFRGATRVATIPFRNMAEGDAKNAIRRFFLKFQHSLPTEFAVNAGDVVCQIGTPWPQTMRRFRRRIGENGRLVIFEALPDNARKLREAVAEGGFTNVDIIERAAWSSPGDGKLSISPFAGDHKIAIDDVAMDNDLKAGNQEMPEIDVRFDTIDNVMAELGLDRLDYLSVTVNGAEHEVLKGAEHTIRAAGRLRIYSKGHALHKNGEPINAGIRNYLQSLGMTAVITRGEPSSTDNETWLWRAGDVFAWKQQVRQ